MTEAASSLLDSVSIFDDVTTSGSIGGTVGSVRDGDNSNNNGDSETVGNFGTSISSVGGDDLHSDHSLFFNNDTDVDSVAATSVATTTSTTNIESTVNISSNNSSVNSDKRRKRKRRKHSTLYESYSSLHDEFPPFAMSRLSFCVVPLP